jgi:hypothetical protein
MEARDMERDILRRCYFTPYRKGMGPTFRLEMWATSRRLAGRDCLGYQLTMREPGGPKVTLFEGEDFGCSPCHAVDSDEAVATLMRFLTLRPGDTDQEYFAEYTPAQLDYCGAHAEALGMEVMDRFGKL